MGVLKAIPTLSSRVCHPKSIRQLPAAHFPGRGVRIYLERISVILDPNWVKTTFSSRQTQSALSDFSDNLTNLSRKKIEMTSALTFRARKS